MIVQSTVDPALIVTVPVGASALVVPMTSGPTLTLKSSIVLRAWVQDVEGFLEIDLRRASAVAHRLFRLVLSTERRARHAGHEQRRAGKCKASSWLHYSHENYLRPATLAVRLGACNDKPRPTEMCPLP